MPAMTNPDDYYQQLINRPDHVTAMKGCNGMHFCPTCGNECKFYKMNVGIPAVGEPTAGHYHCFECGEIR